MTRCSAADPPPQAWYPPAPWWIWALLVGVTIAVYANSVPNGFHYDDVFTILRNPAVQEVERLPQHFWSATIGNQEGTPSYRPLLMLTYGLNYWWGGTHPAGYHVVNIGLHVMASVLVVLLLWNLSGHAAAAVLCGFVFALHPIQTEAVNYITARSSVLYAVAGLAAVVAFTRYRATGRVAVLAGSVLVYVAALLAKEAAVVVPVLLIGYDVIVRRLAWRDLARWGPPHAVFVTVTVVYLAFRRLMMGEEITSAYQGYHADVLTAGVTFAAMVAQTLSDQLVPINLTVSHAFAPVRELTARAVGALLVVATVAAVGIVAHRRRAGVLAFAAIWFVVALLPLAALPLITALALYQENRGYLSAVAVAWVAGVLLAWCWESDRVRQKGLTVLRRGMVVLLLGAMALAVVIRNPVWRDDVSLWRDALSKAPGNQAAYVNLGAAYQARGDLQAAAEVYQRAVERFPRNAILHNNLGALYRASGDLRRAAEEFRAAIRVNPGFAMAFFNLGRALQEVGARDEAIAAFQRFLALAPSQPGAMPSIPQARQRLGELESGVPAQSPPPN